MAWTISDARIIAAQGITSVICAASVARAPIRTGTRVRGSDPVYGSGEFIYLPTLASATIGTLVTFHQSGSGVFTTAMMPNSVVIGRPVAVAMGTGAATSYGWFAVVGTVPVKKTATIVAPNVALFISATTGRVMPTATSGKMILNMRASNSASVLSATSTVYVTMQYPFMQGRGNATT